MAKAPDYMRSMFMEEETTLQAQYFGKEPHGFSDPVSITSATIAHDAAVASGGPPLGAAPAAPNAAEHLDDFLMASTAEEDVDWAI